MTELEPSDVLLGPSDPNVVTITTSEEDADLKDSTLPNQPDEVYSIGGGVELLKQPNKYMFFIEGVKNQLAMPSMDNLRPWGAMIADMERPSSLSEATTRVSHNQAHYRTNYLFLAAAFAACTIFTTPSLFWMALIAGGFAIYTYYWKEPYEIGVPFTNRKMTSGMLVKVVAGVCLLVTVYTGSIVTLLWTLFITLVAAMGHSVMRKVPEENLFGEDIENGRNGGK